LCFSAEADLLAAVAVGCIGIDAVRHVDRREELPLACLPLVLGAHQLVEAFVWWGLEDRVPYGVGRAAIWIYLVIAFGVIPVMVPAAVAALEPEPNRRRMAAFTALGGAVAMVLLFAVLRGPVVAQIQGHHIAYSVDLRHGGLIVALYVVATCGPMLMSRHRHVRVFGAVNLVAAATLTWVASSAFISLWCLWAAVTSGAIALHLRHTHRQSLGRLIPAPRHGIL